MLNLLINGACGQMGRTIIRMAQKQPEDFRVVAGVDPAPFDEAEGVPVVRSYDDAPEGVDVVIDFSRPSALPAVLKYCQEKNVKLVLGTTGLDDAQKKNLERAAAKVAIFHSGNMSLGVNLQIELIKKAAAALGEGYEPEIIEKHHHLKVDAPSGTALMLADALSTQYACPREYVYGRHTRDTRRKPNEIGIHAVRGGTIVGEHYVDFYGQDEVVSINHKAYSKQVFATGALRAALYIMNKQPGLYNMRDIVTEKDVLSHLYTEENQAVINIGALPHEPGVLSAIFSTVADHNIFVDMISMTASGSMAGDVSFSLPKDQLASALNALKELRSRYMGMDVHAIDNITKVTVEGPGMAIRHGVASKLFSVLSDANVTIELVTTSETKISCCIRNSDVSAALAVITKQFSL
ncbi:4-hydroxy-tetrahydrodipicolinate reductase [Christensenellaceae bacterium OttesenSCG-928-M15]|nr:4-hydroxy-tetrahydrodipicolinate reductase [Christensenellaceae bacterium OttesenSCG-928-M15]